MSADCSRASLPPAGRPFRLEMGTIRGVSIVIPTRCREDALGKCLNGLSEWRGRAEVVVVDDDPQGTADRVCERFPGVRRIRTGGIGAAAARNLGAEASATPWIAFLDDDCLPRHGWLEGLIAACASDPSVLSAGHMVNGLAANPYATATQELLDFLHSVDNGVADDARFVASANLLVSREAFLAMGGFDAGYRAAGGEDRDFCLRWRQSGGRIRWCSGVVVDHYHGMGLKGFCRQHFRYGAGAARFHALDRQQGSRDGRGFCGVTWYLKLLVHPFRRHSMVQAPRLAALLAVAQFMTAMGVAGELLRWRRA